ncbi:hypothetical protein FS837_000458, partial [Tulasnella sp. UAMH 9824]
MADSLRRVRWYLTDNLGDGGAIIHSNSEDNPESQQGDRVNEKTAPDDKHAAEGRSRESGGKALPGRK